MAGTATPTPSQKELDDAWHEQVEEATKREESFDALLSDADLAKYKIEVIFSHAHSAWRPTTGLLIWWESGRHLNGEGDAKLYLCENSYPGSAFEGRGCGKFIPDSAHTGMPFVICPHCFTKWDPSCLTGEIGYNLPLQKWAEVIHRWFVRLESRADICLTYGRMSIRDAQRMEEERHLQGELLTKARSKEQRTPAIYPLKSILKDTANGSDLTGRILAFLNA